MQTTKTLKKVTEIGGTLQTNPRLRNSRKKEAYSTFSVTMSTQGLRDIFDLSTSQSHIKISTSKEVCCKVESSFVTT